jgi:hypothetical protein
MIEKYTEETAFKALHRCYYVENYVEDFLPVLIKCFDDIGRDTTEKLLRQLHQMDTIQEAEA